MTGKARITTNEASQQQQQQCEVHAAAESMRRDRLWAGQQRWSLLLLVLVLMAPVLTSAAGQLPAAAVPYAAALKPAAGVLAAAPAPLQQQQQQQPFKPRHIATSQQQLPVPANATAGTSAAPTPLAPPPLPDHPPLPPQRVADVLLGLYSNYAGPVFKAASHFLNFGLLQAEPGPVQLPQCQQTNVLLNSGVFPGPGWANLTAQQQTLHPVNLVMLQLSYMAYRPLSDLTSCLTGMGADLSSLQNLTMPITDFSTHKTAYVFRAGRERVFVLFRGSCETDLVINIACRQEQPAHELFGLPGGAQQQQIGLHRGYWRAWQALEPAVLAAVQKLLQEVPSKEVYIVGHSLGAAMGSIAALRLNSLLPRGVSGVFMYAAPRAGNAAWAAAYNKALLHKTVRFANYLDFAVRVPSALQSCSLGSMSLQAETGRFDYAHVGRAVLMCPEHDTGLTQFRVSPNGSDTLDCFGRDEVDATGATHQLGSYFDAWRRGHVKYTGNNLADDLRARAVLCSGCTVNFARFKMEQIRCPARAGAPVTCAVDASCSSDVAFGAALAVGNVSSVRAGNSTTCQAYMCHPQQHQAGQDADRPFSASQRDML